MLLSDWQMLHWVMAPLWEWSGVPYNPEALTSKAWLAELRAGRYRGRPRTNDRPYGGAEAAGHWAEFEQGVVRHPHRQRRVELERLGGAPHGHHPSHRPAVGRRHPVLPGGAPSRRRPPASP